MFIELPPIFLLALKHDRFLNNEIQKKLKMIKNLLKFIKNLTEIFLNNLTLTYYKKKTKL